MAPQHSQNPSYCGVCRVWVSGLSQHQTRSKTHLRLYEPIRQRLVAQKAERSRGEAPTTPGVGVPQANNSAAAKFLSPV